MTWASLTWAVFVALAGVLLALELVLIVAEARRTSGPRVRTISMVVRDQAYRWTCTPYVWGTLATHYFPPWPRSSNPYTDWGYGVAIGLAVLLLASDVALRRHHWASLPRAVRWLRWPFLWLLVGLASGTWLFAQTAPAPWEGP